MRYYPDELEYLERKAYIEGDVNLSNLYWQLFLKVEQNTYLKETQREQYYDNE